jgi:TPP-dependent pyruvate/acetoin dehydrogenase alpha subunit
VFIVENNGWAQFTPQKLTSAQPEIWRKAEGYSIPGKVADGTDILEVYATSMEAINHARRGGGPTLIEYKVKRWLGHYIGDPQKYRDQGEIEEAQRVDPIVKFQQKLIEEGVLNSQRIDELDQLVKNEIDAAIEFARNSLPPEREQAFENVYVE